MELILLVLIFVVLLGNLFVSLKGRGGSGESLSPEALRKLDLIEKDLTKFDNLIRQEFGRNREESSSSTRQAREELGNTLKSFGDTVSARMVEVATLQKNQLETFSSRLTKLTETNELKMDKMRETVENKLQLLQEDNSKKLEQMRATVDEKLHATLEKRLGESFKQVSDRLEQVHKGLGEMQSLATGVGDLKRVLQNVKTRGTLGEIQLGCLLEQILTPEQYETNVAVKKGSNERVEFAIKLPGRDEDDKVWLPIDSKFPVEDYQRLLEAYDNGDPAGIEEVSKQLERRIKACAKDIKDKYINPPESTDFGIMFLPIEGLYAEVLRRNGLFETLQRDYRVIITGPTTLAALLNSLQMGFRTLAVEKRSSEVWELLGAVKTEFGKFGRVLEKTQKKLQEATNTIELANTRTRVIEKKLKKVEELPVNQTITLLGEIDGFDEMDESDSA